ncbi:hypothetical protein C2S51_021757 [Perilla frutescens var. frutescens]|nr:hypothetical protein C2S51_021757 [Perilla frutescens var. frutescens]
MNMGRSIMNYLVFIAVIATIITGKCDAAGRRLLQIDLDGVNLSVEDILLVLEDSGLGVADLIFMLHDFLGIPRPP